MTRLPALVCGQAAIRQRWEQLQRSAQRLVRGIDKPPYTVPKPDGATRNAPIETELLASGMPDDAIAKHLGLSHRTFQRRLRALLDRLGAATRFQAGLRTAHRGWLAD